MVIFRSIFSVFLSFDTQLTHLNASNLLNFDPSNRFLPIASQSWCSGVSKMATYIYIYRAALYVVRCKLSLQLRMNHRHLTQQLFASSFL